MIIEKRVIPEYLEDDPPAKKDRETAKRLAAEIKGISENPVLPKKKVRVTLYIDPETADFFRSTGRDWQPRINAILRNYVQTQKLGQKK